MSSRTSSVVIGVLGVALVALAVYTVARTSDLSSQVSDLEDTASRLEGTATASGKDAADISDLSAGLKRLRACIPEIQNELNSMKIEYGYVETGSQVSSYCSPIVYPPPSGPGE